MGANLMRYEDWPERLDRFIEEHSKSPFEYGINDCCLFGAKAIETIVDIKIVEEVNKLHKGKNSRKNLANLVAKTLKTYNFKEIPPLAAQRGDIVLFETELGTTVGISVGGKITAPGESGLEFFPLDVAKTAWRIE